LDADRAPQLKAGVRPLLLAVIVIRLAKMYYSLKLILLCFALVNFTSAIPAQDAKQKSVYPKRTSNHDAKFVTEYEAAEDTTIVFLEPVIIEPSESVKPSLRLAASFQYEGKSPVKPKHISLAFYALYSECKFSGKPKMMMLIDEERIEFGFSFKSFRERKPDEEGVAFSFNEMEGERCDELMFMFISQKNFLKVVNARNVQVQIDDFKFKLKESNLEALRDLASRMVM
jgi:hypothetical protein